MAPSPLQSLAAAARTGWKVLLVGILAGLAVAIVALVFSPTLYNSTASVIVIGEPLSDSAADITAASFVALDESQRLVEQARSDSDIAAELEERDARLFVIAYTPRLEFDQTLSYTPKLSNGSAVVRVTVEAPTAGDAQNLAASVAETLYDSVRMTETLNSSDWEPGDRPASPAAPSVPLYLVMGGVLGLGAAIGTLALLRARAALRSRSGR